jgi:hypothetical protein
MLALTQLSLAQCPHRVPELAREISARRYIRGGVALGQTSSLADPGRNRRDRHRLDRAEDDRPQQSINPPDPEAGGVNRPESG